jgi:1-acyl-sn-glycerol-3-phosphate acyltransferase
VETGERAPLLYRVLHAVLPPVLNALYRPWTEGMENLPESGPAILASNHLSFLDSIFLPAVCERPIYFLGKSDYFSGWRRYFFEGVGVMPVQRQGGDAGEASLRKGQEILETGNLLGIYPEGTRSPDGRLYRGKTGPVRLALRTGAPIIPVAMMGTFEILPPDANVPKISRVGVRVGRPLDFAGRYGNADDDRFVLRSATDELMYELMMLSGQEYVDEYAAKVKSGEVSIGSGDLDELGQMMDQDDLVVRRAS